MKKNIIILDNRSYVRYRIKLAMDQHLYEVHEASNSMELFRQLKELNSSVDVVVMEINLNNEDGFEVIKELRKKNISIPIMVLSELKTRKDVIKSFKMGATDYFIKPFSDDLISKRIIKNSEVKNLKLDANKNIKIVTESLKIDNDRDYINNEINKAKGGGYEISIVMSVFYKLDKSIGNELDQKYLTLTDYIYEKTKEVFKDSDEFLQFGIQTFIAIYTKCDKSKMEKILMKINEDYNKIKLQDSKIMEYSFKNIAGTYPQDGSNYIEIINTIKEKLKKQLTQKII